MNISRKTKISSLHATSKVNDAKRVSPIEETPQSQEAQLSDALWYQETQVMPLLSPFWAWRTDLR